MGLADLAVTGSKTRHRCGRAMTLHETANQIALTQRPALRRMPHRRLKGYLVNMPMGRFVFSAMPGNAGRDAAGPLCTAAIGIRASRQQYRLPAERDCKAPGKPEEEQIGARCSRSLISSARLNHVLLELSMDFSFPGKKSVGSIVMRCNDEVRCTLLQLIPSCGKSTDRLRCPDRLWESCQAKTGVKPRRPISDRQANDGNQDRARGTLGNE